MKMPVLARSSLVVVGLLYALTVAGAKEPHNLYLLKQEIRAYVDTGEYDRDLATVAEEAKAWLRARMLKPSESTQGRPAIVFDIDETLLSNLSHMQQMDYGYQPVQWDAWLTEGTAPAIKPVAELFHLARSLGIAVFLMSGRHEDVRAGTEQNLREAGLGDYAGLALKPRNSPGTTESFKTATRKKITEDGFTILLNIGDQQSDLNGGYAEKTFKLPNPFYITK